MVVASVGLCGVSDSSFVVVAGGGFVGGGFMEYVKYVKQKINVTIVDMMNTSSDTFQSLFGSSSKGGFVINPDGTVALTDEDVVVLELIMEDWPGCGLHLNVDKTEVFWPKEDPRSRLAESGQNHWLMDAIAKIDNPHCELLLLRSCTGISKLYFTITSCPPRFFESAQRFFDVALRSSLEHIVTTFGSGFGDWQWRLTTLLFVFGELGVYSAGDDLNYTFLASRLQSADLQTKLIWHTGIVSPRRILDDALSLLNTSIETNLLSNPSEIAAPKFMKKMADIYFPQFTKNVESTFTLSSQQMALWTSQREDHTSDWLRTVPISGLGLTMNGKTYCCVLCYHLGIPFYPGLKPCSANSRVFARDIYGDHAILCARIIFIKHRHNLMRDTLVDICYHYGISAGKEVDLGLDGGVTNHYV
uniref:Uncharacterized protein n=1 Tax=Tanacetum cinerariifolium TaxID=118510 RepID=A0A699H4Y5_TANCI|nr:hypothetical protein [Tanacetum cinerariifolium]